MASPANVVLVHLDAWGLRCIFSHSLLLARVAAGELYASPKNKGNPSPRSQDPPGTRGQMFTYRDRNGDEVATVHYYHMNGSPRSEPDPKTIRIGPKRYVIHPEDAKANPEKRLFGADAKKMRKLYGCYRKCSCSLRGPVDTVPLAGG